ncbi:hypothetical protein MTO96_003687 [Rhipicephalus appendiculatus]
MARNLFVLPPFLATPRDSLMAERQKETVAMKKKERKRTNNEMRRLGKQKGVPRMMSSCRNGYNHSLDAWREACKPDGRRESGLFLLPVGVYEILSALPPAPFSRGTPSR